jgi:hypothetical protein
VAIISADRAPSPSRGRLRRVGWFVAIYAASVIGFGAVAYGLHAIVPH